jgi:NAD(P)-dependent dehydrogenase (short-subunit alcohol dehydrogenase family)
MGGVVKVTYATNYFGPFYFTVKLLPLLKQSAKLSPSRIVWNSSAAEALGKVDWNDLMYVPTRQLMVGLRELGFVEFIRVHGHGSYCAIQGVYTWSRVYLCGC